MYKFWIPFFAFIAVCVLVFIPLLTKGYLPIPSDSLVGLYHPFRDYYVEEYPNGIPFKNFLITDPVRQQIPWRFLAVSEMKNMSLPLWNPYTFAGTPLLANIQSAPFYPFNILFFILPFAIAWSTLVFIQPILMGVFLFFYLRYLKVSAIASLFASAGTAFSGFSVAWMEWNTVVQTALWLPLILLSIEKIIAFSRLKSKRNKLIGWSAILLFSLSASLFAGHLQTFFYLLLVSFAYSFFRLFQEKSGKITYISLAGSFLLFILVTSIQWLPAVQFILLSARDVDQIWTQPGWFIPWQHLIQFLVPDFFGNPTTLNYFGVWNYAELVGYIGLIPFTFALYAIVVSKRKIVFFFIGILVISLLFSLDSPLSRLPFQLSIPFLSTSQPTRLLFLVDFSLVMLTAFGIDSFQKSPRKFFIPLSVIGILLMSLWVIDSINLFVFSAVDLAVSKRNLYLPTLLFVLLCMTYLFICFVKDRRMMWVGLSILFLITSFDSFRFAQKFLSFTSNVYFYPETSALNYLQSNVGLSRIMSDDPRILPPNTSIMYKLQTIEGYDPLYLKRYGELMVALKRNKPDISSPFGFNRIITHQSIDDSFKDLLGIKYTISLFEKEGKKVYQEGNTRIYENDGVFERAFDVQKVISVETKQEAIDAFFKEKENLSTVAIVEGYNGKKEFSDADVTVVSYSENKVVLKVKAEGTSFVVLMDSYYPTWKAILDNKDVIPIYQTNYNFRGVIVPSGTHSVEFTNTLFTYGH